MDSDKFEEIAQWVEAVVHAWHRHEGTQALERQGEKELDAINKKYEAFQQWMTEVREIAAEYDTD